MSSGRAWPPHCPVCSMGSQDVQAQEQRQGIVPETGVDVEGSVLAMDVDAEGEGGTWTDVSATTEEQPEAVPAPEAVSVPDAVPAPEAVPAVPATEAVPVPEAVSVPEAVLVPETALAQVIIITTITCLLVAMITIHTTVSLNRN